MADILEPAEHEMTMLIRGRLHDMRSQPKTPMFWTGCLPTEYPRMEDLEQEILAAKEMLKWAHLMAVHQCEDLAFIGNKDKKHLPVPCKPFT